MFIKQITPLILPQHCFIDCFNRPNAFIDTNPSLFIDIEGNVTLLVRSVNYRKFFDKNFSMYERHSKSLYKIMRGHIDNLHELSCDIVVVENNLPTYPTFWLGLEDIRFIDSSTLLITIPSCNKDGNPSIFKAVLTNNTIHSFVECYPNVIEKNWMPFYDEKTESFKVLYSVDPFTVKSIENDDRQELNLLDLKGYHGSTNGVKINDTILFMVHTTLEKVYHRWVLFNPKTNEIKVSDSFVFFNYSYIEFSCSLCFYNNRLFVSLGVNDDKAFILELNTEKVFKLFYFIK